MIAILGPLLFDNRAKIGLSLTARKKHIRFNLIIALFLHNTCHVSSHCPPPHFSSHRTMLLKPRRSIRAKKLLQVYTRHSKAKLVFAEACRKRRKQVQPGVRRSIRDELRSISSEVKLLTDNTFELLQPELVEHAVAGLSSDETSSEDTSSTSSSQIESSLLSEDISMSDSSSSDDDDSTFADVMNSTPPPTKMTTAT